MTEIYAPPISVFGKDPEGFTKYEVTIEMLDKLMGGVPNNERTIDGWIAKGMGIKDAVLREPLVKQTLEERGYVPEHMDTDDLMDAIAEVSAILNTNGFKRDNMGLYIEGRQIMAMLRESCEVLYTGLKWKRPNGATSKAAYKLFRETVHVPDQRIYVGRHEPDGTILQIVHPNEGLNRDSSLTYVDYVEQPELTFMVEEVTGAVPDEAWPSIWRLSERKGLGAARSQQYGKFAVTRWEVLD